MNRLAASALFAALVCVHVLSTVAAWNCEEKKNYFENHDWRHSAKALFSANVVVHSRKMPSSNFDLSNKKKIRVLISCFLKGCYPGSSLDIHVSDKSTSCIDPEKLAGAINEEDEYVFLMHRVEGRFELVEGGIIRAEDFRESFDNIGILHLMYYFNNGSRKCNAVGGQSKNIAREAVVLSVVKASTGPSWSQEPNCEFRKAPVSAGTSTRSPAKKLPQPPLPNDGAPSISYSVDAVKDEGSVCRPLTASYSCITMTLLLLLLLSVSLL